MKNNVLILGGNGFIGKNLAKNLSEEYDVTIMDAYVPEEKLAGVSYIAGDFFNDRDLRELVRKYDNIVHAICTINPSNCSARYLSAYQKDFVQAVKLCGWLQESGGKMIFLSSGGTVYGSHEDWEFPLKENSTTRPINQYGCLKLCIEDVIRSFNAQYGSNHKIARITNPYGPGQDHNKGVGFVDAALKKAIKGEPLEIWGDGKTVRDYIYIEDVCKMLKALIRDESQEDTYNLSSGEGISQLQVLEEMKNLGLQVNVVWKDARNTDLKKIILDNHKIREIYDQEIRSFSKGIRLYYEYLKSIL